VQAQPGKKSATSSTVARSRRSIVRARRLNGPWDVVLAAFAAEAHDDGGAGLKMLLRDAGFTKRPSVTLLIRRTAA
jgi:hypothetical protein